VGTPEAAVRALLESLGHDPSADAELAETPGRAANALREMLSGYAEDVPSLFKTFDVGAAFGGVVVVKGVEFHSLCAHHLMPFWGVAHVAYAPRDRVLGLSKIPRLVQALARRLQLQERLTAQITGHIDHFMAPRGSACLVEATHACLCARGVRSGAKMSTSSLTGCFARRREREEFFAMARGWA
jgi:GTP cyclohydrolase I